MDLSELTRKMDAFVDSKGWYSPGSSRPQTPRNLAISLSLESNEVLEHFQWGEEIIDKQELANELAESPFSFSNFHLSLVLIWKGQSWKSWTPMRPVNGIEHKIARKSL